MSATDNLGVTHVLESQNNKEVTMNEALDIFDGAIAGLLSVNLDGVSSDTTPDEDAMVRAFVVRTSGVLGADINLIVPDINKAYMIVNNATAFDVTITTAAGSGVTLTPTDAQLVYCDGVNVIAISTVGAGGAAQGTEKTAAFLTGAGGTTAVAIGANVDPNTVDAYADGIRLRRAYDYTVTESAPGSGNYDEITPAYAEALPSGANLEVLYYV